jgi:SAM-dependent methyltransferase
MNIDDPAMPGGAAAKTHTGAEYFNHITLSESDRLARAAFQHLVLELVPPGGALFDFGAGAGIDAKFFAERGYSIDAYDVDPKMCEFFAEYCREFIDSGRITLTGGGYREFLAREPHGAGRLADLVISNFAPLNLVDDLPPLFAKFHALTAPGGQVLASVLSPYFIGDMKNRWWWRNTPRLWWHGHYFMPGPQAPHLRRSVGDFNRLSLPHFSLVRVFRGLPYRRQGPLQGVDMRRGGRRAWLHVAGSRFMFLLFEKCAPPKR